jgi:hypothetical protein
MKGVRNDYMNNISKNEGCVIDIPGGRLTEPLGDYTPYNFREMIRYCEERNTLPKYLTDEERDQFIIKRDKSK